MKALSTLLLFTVLLLGSQKSNAQNTLEINAEANTRTKEISQAVKLFETDKMEQIYEAYQNYGLAYKRLNKSTPVNPERLKKINTILDQSLKAILTEGQYTTYLKQFRSK